ncbi:MAG: hypothetical protein GDA56_24610 [Hormoscilla sp. GM7CHS1pb]|nr:hypothetical protein [Hormoscilla sp. GM7CHS1pb]MBC6480483.1 hypothetical protein [Hormoscilla sp. GM7CHS1pb]
MNIASTGRLPRSGSPGHCFVHVAGPLTGSGGVGVAVWAQRHPGSGYKSSEAVIDRCLNNFPLSCIRVPARERAALIFNYWTDKLQNPGCGIAYLFQKVLV